VEDPCYWLLLVRFKRAAPLWLQPCAFGAINFFLHIAHARLLYHNFQDLLNEGTLENCRGHEPRLASWPGRRDLNYVNPKAK
jgi:hypothetical protein